MIAGRWNQWIDQTDIALNRKIRHVGVFAQDAAEVAAWLLATVAESVVYEIERGVVDFVVFEGAGEFVIGLAERLSPKNDGCLKALVSEASDQNHRQDGGDGILRFRRTKAESAYAENDPAGQSDGMLDHAVPVTPLNGGGQSNREDGKHKRNDNRGQFLRTELARRRWNLRDLQEGEGQIESK